MSFNGTSISLEQALERPCGATLSWWRWGARPRSPAARGAAGRADPQPGSVLELLEGDPARAIARPASASPSRWSWAVSAARGWRWRNAARSPGPNWKSVAPNCAPRSRRLLRGADRAGAGAPGEDLLDLARRVLQAADRRGQGRQHLLGGTGSRPGPGGQRPARPEPGGAGAAAHLCSCSSTWDDAAARLARGRRRASAVPASITRGALLRHLDESPTLRQRPRR